MKKIVLAYSGGLDTSIILRWLQENYKAEIIAYIEENYPGLSYSKTKCKNDVGLIMDNVAYDLTYGGNWMSVEAGKAYFNGNTNTLQIQINTM